MKILLVYPKYPNTFWSFKYALKFISKKATQPPLGLLTVAAMLPKEWEKKLVDMNVNILKDKDLEWADYVFISAMSIQKASVKELIVRCKKMYPRRLKISSKYKCNRLQPIDYVFYLLVIHSSLLFHCFTQTACFARGQNLNNRRNTVSLLKG